MGQFEDDLKEKDGTCSLKLPPPPSIGGLDPPNQTFN
jgi:hypothetical protein